MPICDIACGMASVPAPTMVLRRLILLLSMEAWPPPCLGLRPRFGLTWQSLVSFPRNKAHGEAGGYAFPRKTTARGQPAQSGWDGEVSGRLRGAKGSRVTTYRAMGPASGSEPLPLENVE